MIPSSLTETYSLNDWEKSPRPSRPFKPQRPGGFLPVFETVLSRQPGGFLPTFKNVQALNVRTIPPGHEAIGWLMQAKHSRVFCLYENHQTSSKPNPQVDHQSNDLNTGFSSIQSSNPSSSYHRHNNRPFPTSPNQPSPICSASTSINTQLPPTFLSFNSPSASDSFSLLLSTFSLSSHSSNNPINLVITSTSTPMDHLLF
ncbi:hypothetical protein PGTUg99_028478 [Puccinia graminis f. sp. tritici]|uniref:Uncharacterized protein n=1 Tax=Puccinia graminis f. sp. tritici TaxID=56615 RepID=A0A5B0RU45_PUCGR|nr:hypothetical protein PGTUg99_028478 [Puccinia graminis f. sp. tritici]